MVTVVEVEVEDSGSGIAEEEDDEDDDEDCPGTRSIGKSHTHGRRYSRRYIKKR